MPRDRSVPVNRLQVGVYIEIEGGWPKDPSLASHFKIEDQKQIDALNQAGVDLVTWVPEKSDCMPLRPADVSGHSTPGMVDPSELSEGPDQTLENLQAQKERADDLCTKMQLLLEAEQKYEDSLEQLKNVMDCLRSGSNEAVEEADSLIKNVIASIVRDKDVALHLVNIKNRGDEYYHALNTAILSMLVGKEYGLDDGPIWILGRGALFHDIGKERISVKLLSKTMRLSRAEQKVLQSHPQYGEEIASEIKGFCSETVRIIRQHHENIDGSGYPDGLAGEQISLLAMITSIVNIYDNHCFVGRPRDSLTPHEACSHMYIKQRQIFDQDLLSRFIRCLGVYPPGTVVRLSNQNLGLVVSINGRNSLRPAVLICRQGDTIEKDSFVELEETPDLFITRSLHHNELPKELYDRLNPREKGIPYLCDLHL